MSHCVSPAHILAFGVTISYRLYVLPRDSAFGRFIRYLQDEHRLIFFGRLVVLTPLLQAIIDVCGSHQQVVTALVIAVVGQ
jgi:hypothetical protein